MWLNILLMAVLALFASAANAHTVPACITRQPAPTILPDDPPHATGTLIVRVELLADGTVGTITVVKDIVDLSEAVIEAARKIEFIPKRVDGTAVDSYRQVEYPYSYGWLKPKIHKCAPN